MRNEPIPIRHLDLRQTLGVEDVALPGEGWRRDGRDGHSDPKPAGLADQLVQNFGPVSPNPGGLRAPTISSKSVTCRSREADAVLSSLAGDHWLREAESASASIGQAQESQDYLRLGIWTFGKVLASMTSLSWMMPLR